MAIEKSNTILNAERKRILPYLIFLFLLSIDQLFAADPSRKTGQRVDHSLIEKINSDLQKIDQMNFDVVEGCNNPDQEDEQKEIEEITNDDSPIYAFQGPSPKIFNKYNLRNDYFAIPINILRYGDSAFVNGQPVIFDQGETHGYSITHGLSLSPNLNLSSTYHSNLYTNIVGRGVNNEAKQTFTNEQIAYVSIDNLHTSELMTYKVDAGYVEHDKANHSDPMRASTQQEWWHNTGSKVYMGQNFYQIINVAEEQFESGLFIRPNIGINSNYLSKGKNFGTKARLYVSPELSTLSKRNNLELGLSGDIYVGTKIPYLKVGKLKINPIDSVGLTVGTDLPLSIHQMHGDKTSKLSSSFIPRANIGANIGFNFGKFKINTELGYELEMVNGTLPNHIQENKQYLIMHKGGRKTDWGDMGAFTLGVNLNF